MHCCIVNLTETVLSWYTNTLSLLMVGRPGNEAKTAYSFLVTRKFAHHFIHDIIAEILHLRGDNYPRAWSLKYTHQTSVSSGLDFHHTTSQVWAWNTIAVCSFSVVGHWHSQEVHIGASLIHTAILSSTNTLVEVQPLGSRCIWARKVKESGYLTVHACTWVSRLNFLFPLLPHNFFTLPRTLHGFNYVCLVRKLLIPFFLLRYRTSVTSKTPGRVSWSFTQPKVYFTN